jgi:hypothetical protein
MDDQYPRLVVESLLARKQLAQKFESEAASEFSPVNDLTLATALQKNAGKDETSIRDRVRSNKSFVHRTSSGTFAKQPGTTKRDINGFSFILILVLLSAIMGSQTDNPVFWLLVGPTPLALAFTANRLLRYRSTRRG